MFFLLIFFIGGLAFSVEYIDPLKAFKIALSESDYLKSLRREVDSRIFEKKSVESLKGPNLSVITRAYYGFPYGEREVFDLYSYLRGEYMIWDWGVLSKEIESADIKIRVEKLMLKRAYENFKIRLVDLFWKIKLAEKRAEVKREEMAVAYVRWDKARNEREEGLLSREEEARLETVYRKKRMELLKAQYDYNRYLNKLVYLIGIDKKDFEILIPDIKVDINGEFKSDYVKGEAFTGNYDMRVGKMLIEYYESKRDGQKYAPQLFVDFGGGYSTRPFGSRYKWYGGIRIELPIYDGGFISARRNFYETKRMKIVDRLNFLKKKIEGEIESLYNRWELIRGCFEYAESLERHSEENLDLKRSEYELELAFDLGYAMSYRSYAELKRMECEHKLTLFLMDVYLLMGKDVFSVFKEEPTFIGEREVTF